MSGGSHSQDAVGNVKMKNRIKSLQSMSGFGRADFNCESMSGYVEIKSVNHRYLKFSIKIPESLNSYYFSIEELIRAQLARGSVFVAVHIKRAPGALGSLMNLDAVKEYKRVFKELGLDETTLPQMPGIVEMDTLKVVNQEEWELIKQALQDALDENVAMRINEGGALNKEVGSILSLMNEHVLEIRNALPEIKENYRESLKERLSQYRETIDIPEDVIAREVLLLVERSDISEELARLDSHTRQVGDALNKGEPCGRSLEFLGQELLREVNTIGSKSHDSQIAQQVIALKVEIEKFREQVANLE